MTIDTRTRLFDDLAQGLFSGLKPGEQLGLNLSAENQVYVRFNQGRVRQITHVDQQRLGLELQKSARRFNLSLDLTGHGERDQHQLNAALEWMRSSLEGQAEDPFIAPLVSGGESDVHHLGTPASVSEVSAAIETLGRMADCAGLYAGGLQYRGARNSLGMRHDFSSQSYFLDYSLFTVNDASENKAIKGCMSARNWDAKAVEDHCRRNQTLLQRLRPKSLKIDPGHYRVYLAPPAFEALVRMLSWGALSYGAYRRGDSAFSRWVEGEVTLSDQLHLAEDFSLGLAPRFNPRGEIAPERLPLIEAGRHGNLLINARSAKEYGVTGNGADSQESLRSTVVQPGALDLEDVIKTLDTGLFIGNLHYLNWSDQMNARVTGMTRYGCFWVEDGEIISPIQDLRFDESLFRCLGSELEALTRTTDIIPATDTYLQRALGGSRVPGALIRKFAFTL